MIGIRFSKPISKSLFNRRCYTATSALRTRVTATGSSERRTNEIVRSKYRRLGHAVTIPSQNVIDVNDIKHYMRDFSHPQKTTVNVDTDHVVELPQYLRRHYWWAYINPTMISILDRKWLVDIVLWGNFTKLRDAAIHELIDTKPHIADIQETSGIRSHGTKIQGKVLQVSCVYADLTETIVENLAADATLDVIDVVPAQLANLQGKLQRSIAISNHDDLKKVSLSCSDASNLSTRFPNNDTFDKVLIFFLLHETPADVRQKVLAEACRVVKRDGKIVIIDYHKPNTAFWCYVMDFMYKIYEPFALDLWKHPLSRWLPPPYTDESYGKETYFCGLYQKLVIKTDKSA